MKIKHDNVTSVASRLPKGGQDRPLLDEWHFSQDLMFSTPGSGVLSP